MQTKLGWSKKFKVSCSRLWWRGCDYSHLTHIFFFNENKNWVILKFESVMTKAMMKRLWLLQLKECFLLWCKQKWGDLKISSCCDQGYDEEVMITLIETIFSSLMQTKMGWSKNFKASWPRLWWRRRDYSHLKHILFFDAKKMGWSKYSKVKCE